MNNTEAEISDERPPQKTTEQNYEQSENDKRNVPEVDYDYQIGEYSIPVNSIFTSLSGDFATLRPRLFFVIAIL